MSTNAVYEVRMYIITVSVTFLQFKIQLLMILNKYWFTELREKLKKKKDSQKGNIFLGVGPVLGG